MRLSAALLPIALIVLVACGGGGTATPAKAPDTATATDDHHHEKHLPPVGPQVHVVLEGKQSDVTLAELPHEGTTVPLLQLWKAAMPNEDPASLHFDLTGSDGFHIGSRPKCTRLLTASELGAARIDVTTHDVTYSDDLKLPGCYRVRAVVRLDATR